MQHTYDDIDLLFESAAPAREETATDRAPDMPLLGFPVASTLALPLWGLIGWTVWALVG